jgi:hypothetical protein
VFRDVDNIPLGHDYRGHVAEALASCATVLVVIGPEWLRVTDGRGRRRLEDPDDPVRVEVETALNSTARVIPLFVRGAVMPTGDELPGALETLAYRNGLPIRADPDFDRDIERLEQALSIDRGETGGHRTSPGDMRSAGRDSQVRLIVNTNTKVTISVNRAKQPVFRSSATHLVQLPPGHVVVKVWVTQKYDFVRSAPKSLSFDLRAGETATVVVDVDSRWHGLKLFSVKLEDITGA